MTADFSLRQESTPATAEYIQRFSCRSGALLGRLASIAATSSPLLPVSPDLLCLRVISPWQQAHDGDTEEETERERETEGE